MPIWCMNYFIETVKNSIVLPEFFAEAYRDIAYAYFEQYSKAYRKLILEKKQAAEKLLAREGKEWKKEDLERITNLLNSAR